MKDSIEWGRLLDRLRQIVVIGLLVGALVLVVHLASLGSSAGAAARQEAADVSLPAPATVPQVPVGTPVAPTPAAQTPAAQTPVARPHPTQVSVPAPLSPAPDPAWVQRTSAATTIPTRAVEAYGRATLRLQQEQPGCRIGWTTLAAIGFIESAHGTHGGSSIGVDGRAQPPIVGPPLDGKDFAHIPDTDAGAFDGDSRYDRAVGPMQFIPSTWERWGADADGDGTRDPQQIDDAAVAAGRYLCHSGPMDTAASWRRAILSYNHSEEYVDHVARVAVSYDRKTS